MSINLTPVEQKTKDALVEAIAKIKEAQRVSGLPNIEVRHILKMLEEVEEAFDFAMEKQYQNGDNN